MYLHMFAYLILDLSNDAEKTFFRMINNKHVFMISHHLVLVIPSPT